MNNKLSINLWFDNQAEEAAKFYTSVFKDSKIIDHANYSTDTPSDKEIGSTMTVEFELNNMRFVALNGGPYFKFNEAISIIVSCDTQDEIDYYWSKLSAVPDSEQCGWLKDKFGVSWQIVPNKLPELMTADQAKSKKVMDALLKMKKIVIADLERASKS